MVLMVAIPNFLVLQPLVPFMRHHSEKKIVEKHPLHNFKFTFSPFSCPMLPSYTVVLARVPKLYATAVMRSRALFGKFG